MKHMLLLAALLSAATASIAQTAAPAAPASAGNQAVAAGGAETPRQGGHGRNGHPDPKKMAARQLSRLDTDKDGKVSRQEYLARQSEAFSKADANGDGFVTQEEMAARHEKHHAAMTERRGAGKAGHASGSQDAQKPAAPAPAK